MPARRRCKGRLPGGEAEGLCPSDFDPQVLAAGTKVELEHTGDRRVAREIAMDHIVEARQKNRQGKWTSDYYRELAEMEERIHHNPSEVGHWYERYHNAVNMTAAEMRRWSKDPCSQLASLDDGPVERNLHLLSTPRSSWGGKEVMWAKRTVSFVARMRGMRSGRPAGPGCPSKRDISLKNWAFDPDKAKSNRRRNRVRVYDAEGSARDMRETFQNAPVTRQRRFSFDWPPLLHNVGDSLAVAYASDKWKKKKKDYELYKHLAESRNRVLCVPGLIVDEDSPSKRWPVIGPMVDMTDVPHPRHFAELALFEEANLKLYTDGTDEDPKFGRGRDVGVVTITVKHGLLGGGKFLWSRDDRGRSDQPFLFVYTERDGVLLIIVGEELDVLKDGIVG